MPTVRRESNRVGAGKIRIREEGVTHKLGWGRGVVFEVGQEHIQES